MLPTLCTELSLYISFSSIFLLLNDAFTLIKICSICLVLRAQVNNFIVSNAYFDKTLN